MNAGQSVTKAMTYLGKSCSGQSDVASSVIGQSNMGQFFFGQACLGQSYSGFVGQTSPTEAKPACLGQANSELL